MGYFLPLVLIQSSSTHAVTSVFPGSWRKPEAGCTDWETESPRYTITTRPSTAALFPKIHVQNKRSACIQMGTTKKLQLEALR